jgi:hypothetical protein
VGIFNGKGKFITLTKLSKSLVFDKLVSEVEMSDLTNVFGLNTKVSNELFLVALHMSVRDLNNESSSYELFDELDSTRFLLFLTRFNGLDRRV